MTEAAKRAKAEYLKKWKAAHPEKQKEYIARYWERKGRELEQSAAGQQTAEAHITPNK